MATISDITPDDSKENSNQPTEGLVNEKGSGLGDAKGIDNLPIAYLTQEQEEKSIQEIVNGVVPLLTGKSFDQIEKAFKKCIGLAKCNLLLTSEFPAPEPA